jgi:membrane-bound lytic murein transglycosylase B
MVYKKPIAFIFILFLFFGIHKSVSLADFDCLQISSSSSEAEKNYCRSELANIEKQLEDLVKKQAEQQKNTGTLKGDVDNLTAQIKTLQTKVKARSLAIASLKVSINEKSSKIATLEDKIDKLHESIAQLLRSTNDFDNENLVHLLLSDKSLFAFYSDLESYASIKGAVKVSVDQLQGIKTETETEKKDLESKRDAETDAKASLETTQKKVAQAENEKKILLSISKNKEAEYKKLAAAKKAQADKIRSALFSLAGVSTKIEFGVALQYANNVKSVTGIDPAFLLAILTQESNLGSNVGQCYLTNAETGEGVGKNTGKKFTNVMKPSRDVPPFLEITNKLGFNAFQTAVSCPIAGVAGWGGAMGPAQFIPSTWKLFQTRLESALGSYPNPWAPKDAFMASGMYLTDLGAVGDSVSAQNKAACKYYGSGGSSCSYSRSVQKLKDTIQDNIDLLQGQ